MKLRILSDLHLEFAHWDYVSCGEDAVLISGDIATVNSHDSMCSLFKSINVPTYCITGNHDFYHSDIINRMAQLKAMESQFPHLHWLHNSTVMLGDTALIATPLWTDFNLFGQPQAAKIEASSCITDFRLTGYRGAALHPNTLVTWHEEARAFLKKEIAKYPKSIVMTHWVPSALFIDPQYAGNSLNPYFTCSMDDLFSPTIQYWIHGHSHGCLDQSVNGTRFIRNTRGYPFEHINWDPNLIISI